MKIRAILTAATMASSAFGTGLSFNTFAPDFGDFVDVDSNSLTDSAVISVGTMNTSDFTSFTLFDYQNSFTELSSASFQNTGEVGVSIGSGTLSAGTTMYGIVYNNGSIGLSDQFAVFEIGVAPDGGVFTGGPASVADVFIGNDLGDNIQLAAVAVPEPSTYVAIAGVLAFGFVAYRRRKQK